MSVDGSGSMCAGSQEHRPAGGQGGKPANHTGQSSISPTAVISLYEHVDGCRGIGDGSWLEHARAGSKGTEH